MWTVQLLVSIIKTDTSKSQSSVNAIYAKQVFCNTAFLKAEVPTTGKEDMTFKNCNPYTLGYNAIYMCMRAHTVLTAHTVTECALTCFLHLKNTRRSLSHVQTHTTKAGRVTEDENTYTRSCDYVLKGPVCLYV